MDALISNIISAGPPSNRPPQMPLAPALSFKVETPDLDFFKNFTIILNLVEPLK